MKTKTVAVYSLIHFIVDFSCAVMIASLTLKHAGNMFASIIIYNFFAFAMQLPVGIIADKVNKNAVCSAVGCLLVAAAFFPIFSPPIACLVAGLGNAMFHVGGGIDVLNISGKKAAFSGIFVSTGAFGIFFGPFIVKAGFNGIYIIILILILSAAALLWLYSRIKNDVCNERMILPRLEKGAVISAVCLIITVCIRSYVGCILAFEWKSNILLAVVSVSAVVFGKMLGGIIADRTGFKIITVISLGISAICFLFAFDIPALGIAAILFFNMTMPVTLTALSNILYNNKGMAFGLLTFALFIGTLPVFFGYTHGIFSPPGLFVTAAVSLIILYTGIHKYNG